MREILFKAKRIDNGKWIEGELFKSYTDDKAYILKYLNTTDFLSYGIPKFNCLGYEVDINTICQYTGTIDKNGNKIWENDIVKRKCFKGVYKIYWCGLEGCWVGKNTIDNIEYLLGCINSHYYEVVGNVFDNPELLKNKEEK